MKKMEIVITVIFKIYESSNKNLYTIIYNLKLSLNNGTWKLYYASYNLMAYFFVSFISSFWIPGADESNFLATDDSYIKKEQ